MVYHEPVLLKESIEALKIKKTGVYVDATFGGGGHSKEILKHLTKGKLYAFDKDKSAIANNKIIDEKLNLINADFKFIKQFLEQDDIHSIDGLLADLGVSSYQINTAERGFSFRFDSYLDMRMNTSSEIDAFYILNNYSEEHIASILFDFGEIYNSRKISRRIVLSRKENAIRTTFDLKNILQKFSRPNKLNQLLAKVFQAIRIEVNQEISSLKKLLEDASDLLNENGRLVIISYHSLEDRLVKNLIKTGNVEGYIEKDFYGNTKKNKIRSVNKKVITVKENERLKNKRSRSAKLRIGERVII